MVVVRVVGWFLWLFGLGAVAHAAPVSVVDDDGRTIELAAPPQRIASLVPSLTETICALDACNRLVATDDYSNWPASVAAIPKVGGPEDPNVELIVRQQPQLVLLARIGYVSTRLAQLGIPTFVMESLTYRDVERQIRTVAAILGQEARGAALSAEIAAAVDAVARGYRTNVHTAARVYFEIDSSPYAAGPTSFIGELLSRLGALNIVTPGLGAFPKLNPEYVVVNNPDVIMLPHAATAPLAQRPGWSAIRAVREGRICTFTDADPDTIMRPGPRVAEGMRAIAACLTRVAP